jgi:hypothetical protein
MPISLPYDRTLQLKIDNLNYENCGPMSIEFAFGLSENPTATVKVQDKLNPTERLVHKPQLPIELAPPSGPKGQYYFQFELSDNNPLKGKRDQAGFLPGTYTFNFIPSDSLPLKGTVSDPHKEGDESGWTAEIPTEEGKSQQATGSRV